MPALYGPVLTNASTVSNFVSSYFTNKFSAAKVVTAWGIDGGWNETNRRLLTTNVSRLIVRSVAGDPSYHGAQWYPEPEALVQEFRPWVALKPDLWLEVGNEPDVIWDRLNPEGRGSDQAIWEYRYWLDQAERRLRREFPQAKLIGPSPRVGHYSNWTRWLEIMADVLLRFDTVSLHLYGWHRIVDDGKGELVAAKPVYDKLFPGKSVAVTELGIHDPSQTPASKLAAYRSFARSAPENWRWVLFYHYNARRDVHPEYSVLP